MKKMNKQPPKTSNKGKSINHASSVIITAKEFICLTLIQWLWFPYPANLAIPYWNPERSLLSSDQVIS